MAWLPVGIFALLVSMAGCREHSPSAGDAQPISAGTETTDAWLGRWDGPEGTYLQLAKSGDKYVVVIQDLDGPKTFDGFGESNRIRFTRDGKTEFISAGDGQATGMKWLAGKKNCLLTKQGEGWCRN